MSLVRDNILNILGTQSCQAMKVAFERTEPEKDVEIFIREYGIGKIPDTSDFVTGSAPDSTPSASAQPTSRIAGVVRSISREIPLLQNSMPLEEGPAADTTGVNEGGTAFKKNEPYTSESVVDPSCQPTAMSSKAQPVPDTNGIQLTASMAKNQNDNVDALTKQLEELQVSTSQNTRRPLTNPPTVDSMVPKFTQPAGAEIAQALTDHEPALPGEHTSPRLRSSSTGRHALSLRQAFISGGGDDDGAPLPTTAPHQDQPILTPQQRQMLMGQHHQMLAAQPQQQEQMFQLLQQQPRMVHVLYHDSIPVWRSPSRLLSQAMDDSDVQVEESGGYCHSSVDEPEVHTPVMLPQLTSDRLNLFLRQQHQHSLNSNVNPINFVIQKRMKLRRIATRVHSLSTSGSSIKLGTDSFISCSS